jgi:hypothetical protein
MTDVKTQSEAHRTLLTEHSEILYRQVHPSWIDGGVPTSQAFTPSPKDKGELSIARSSLTTAEAAHKHYTTVLGCASAGSWAITVGEADKAALESFGDPLSNDPAHGFVDFRGLSKNEAKRRGTLLAARARERGRLHPETPG